MNYEPARKQLTFVLPESSRSAELTFVRVSGHPTDIRVRIPTDTQIRRVVSTAPLSPGLWRVHLDWSADNGKYYREKVIEIK